MNEQAERDNAEIESLLSLNTVPIYTMTLAAAVQPYALTAAAEPWWAILAGAGGLLRRLVADQKETGNSPKGQPEDICVPHAGTDRRRHSCTARGVAGDVRLDTHGMTQDR